MSIGQDPPTNLRGLVEISHLVENLLHFFSDDQDQ